MDQYTPREWRAVCDDWQLREQARREREAVMTLGS